MLPRRSTSSSSSSRPSLSCRRSQPEKSIQILDKPALSIQTPTFGQSNEVLLQTGWNLTPPADRRHRHDRSSLDPASSASSSYSDLDPHSSRDASPGGIRGRYSKWGSWSPVPESLSVSKQRPREQQPFECLPTGRPARLSAPPSTSHREPTLNALIREERARFEHDSFALDIWQKQQQHPPGSASSPSPPPSPLSRTSTGPPLLPSPSASFLHELTHGTSFPLRQRSAAGSLTSLSRFSDHSSTPTTTGSSAAGSFVGGIRQSLVARVRHLSLAPRESRVWELIGAGGSPDAGASGAVGDAAAAAAPAGNAGGDGAGKRKRRDIGSIIVGAGNGAEDDGGRPMSPGRSWGFRSPLHKKTLRSPRKPKQGAGVVRRISEAFMHANNITSPVPGGGGSHGGSRSSPRDDDAPAGLAFFSSGRAKRSKAKAKGKGKGKAGEHGNPLIIPDHSRTIGGPDTPRPAPAAEAKGGGWMAGILAGEGVRRAREGRWIVGREERRRERLKGRIRIVREEGGREMGVGEGRAGEWM